MSVGISNPRYFETFEKWVMIAKKSIEMKTSKTSRLKIEKMRPEMKNITTLFSRDIMLIKEGMVTKNSHSMNANTTVMVRRCFQKADLVRICCQSR